MRHRGIFGRHAHIDIPNTPIHQNERDRDPLVTEKLLQVLGEKFRALLIVGPLVLS